MKYIVTLSLILCIQFVQGQNTAEIDSLTKVYQNAQQDTTKILTLSKIGFRYYRTNPDTCLYLAQKALNWSRETNYQKGQVESLNIVAIHYYVARNYDKALDNYKEGLNIAQEINYNKGIVNISNNMALIYTSQGKLDKTLEYRLIALKIQENTGDKIGIAKSYMSIGNIHLIQSEPINSLEYYQKALNIYQEANVVKTRGSLLHNMGLAYSSLGEDSLALEHFQQSLELNKELGNEKATINTLSGIGDIYEKQQKYQLAGKYFEKSLQIAENTQDKSRLSNPLSRVAAVYQKAGNYEKSIKYALRALEVAEQNRSLTQINVSAFNLYNTYKRKGDYISALKYHELYKKTNDSLYNAEKSKAIADLESKAEVEHKEKEIAILNKNQELLEKDNELQQIETERQRNAKLALEKQAEAERLLALARQEKDKRKQDSLQSLAQQTQLEADRLKAHEKQLEAESKARKLEVVKEREAKEFQQYINYLVIAGLISMLIFAFFIYHSRQKERKAKNQIQKQKEDLQILNAELKQTQEEVITQRDYLDERNQDLDKKNQQISSSITSAHRIQKAILPHPEKLHNLLPEHFIVYRPRDIVSGDFYWIEEVQNYTMIAIADCTGHGVPGAFMTMIGNTLLDRIIRLQNITNPAEVLQKLHQEIHILLNQHTGSDNSGMDLALIRLESMEEEKTQITFAGAKVPMYYFSAQTKQIKKVRGTRRSIGGIQNENTYFENQEFIIEKGSLLYAGSDGLQDQNNRKRKKFGSTRLKNFLLQNRHLDMKEQGYLLEKELDNFMVGTEQRDDILWVGVKV